ncbi:MAG: fused MFS/spermidine synthase [Flavobacteriales bacterium]|nr:fused MFS/spermidine synthase [Flavobacteriales bacterium]
MKKVDKYRSYLSRVIVEETSSKYNDKLVVAIQNGKYVLNSTNANYSFASLHRVFQQALKLVNLREKQDILVLGCGAGSIPSIIYKEFKLNAAIDAVEIDEQVIRLGNKYFGLNHYENLTIIIGNALNYVKTANKKYDLICVDLFKGIQVPDEFLSQQFFQQLNNLLVANGEILFNFVAYNYETKEQVKTIEEGLESVFKTVKVHRFEEVNRIFHIKKKE